MSTICDDLDGLGYPRVTFRSDGEPAIVALLQQVKAHWSGDVVPEKSAEGDHQSNGSAECGVGLMKGQVRTLKQDLETKIGVPVPEDHNILTWFIF